MLSKILPSTFKYIFAISASAEIPPLLTLREVILTLSPVNVSLNPSIKACAPSAVSGVSGVVVVVVVVVATELYFACEIGPKNPTAGDTLLLACHEATAALVAEPKYPVEPPEKVKCPVLVK